MESFALLLSLFFAQAPAPVSGAEAEERLRAAEKEEMLRAKLPYDCLGGVCLNAQASVIPEKIVQVVGHNFRRYTTTCKGRVVLIRLTTSWTHLGYSDRAIPGANILWHVVEDSDVVLGPTELYIRLDKGLETLGWESSRAGGRWTSPKVQGDRSVEDFDDMTSGDTTMSIISEHPRKDELCAYQGVQGL